MYMNNFLSNVVVIDGGEVKSKENGVVTGMGIVFGSPSEPDQSAERDFFTPETFIQTKTSFEVPLYHNHGFPIKRQIGEATLTKTDSGWKAEAKIDLEDPLGKEVYKAVKSSQYGFSTGALAHLVQREGKENNTNFLSMWPVGELSLTPRPAERKAVVQAVKSVNDAGEAVFAPAWPSEEDISGGRVVALFDENGTKIWDEEDGSELEDFYKNARKVELKFTNVNGSVTYEVYTYDSETDKGTNIVVYEWGGVEDFIGHLQDVLNVAAAATKNDGTDIKPLTESAVKDIVRSMLPKDEGNEQISELKKQLQEREQELADLEAKNSESEDALTKAREDIARLEILAGAKNTITKSKGK